MSNEMKKLIMDVKTELKAEIGAVKAELKTEIGEVRSELKAEIGEVKSELGRVNERLDGHDVWLRGITTEQARARGDIEWLKENMVSRGEFRAAMDQVLGRFDGFASKFDEFRLRWAVQSDTLSQHHHRLEDHEKRLAILEPKRA